MPSWERRGGRRANPIAAMVPTNAEIRPTETLTTRLFRNAPPNCRCSIIASHHLSDRWLMGKLLIPRSVKEKSTTSSSGASRKKTNRPPSSRHRKVAAGFIGAATGS